MSLILPNWFQMDGADFRPKFRDVFELVGGKCRVKPEAHFNASVYGVVNNGIPSYRLPKCVRERLDKEIKEMMGV